MSNQPEPKKLPENAAQQPPSIKTGAHLNVARAVLNSFFDLSLDFYPRLGSEVRSVPSHELIKRFYDAKEGGIMVPWSAIKADDPNLDKAIDLAKASLQEAKAQTEYQDQNATRLLTVSTFLTALAGAFYTAFSAEYPLKTLSEQPNYSWWPLVLAHLAFFLFILFSLAGALVTFHASRTRFKYPSQATVDKQSGTTGSYLFFREMIGVTPEGWANSFVTVAGSDKERTATINPNLKVEYLKNYVSEAYLVAAKTADKLRFLQPAQSLLSFALRCLMVFIVLLAWVLTQLPPTRPTPAPTEVKIVSEQKPTNVHVGQPPILAPTPVPKASSQP